jgi:hypothetical protein
MDDFERLRSAYRLRALSSAPSRLSVLRDLDLIRDARVLPFLLTVLADTTEPEEVRIHVLKQLRNGDKRAVPENRPLVATAITAVMTGQSSSELRIQAALALGEFLQLDGVLAMLGNIVLASAESLDLRYAAFISMQRAEATPESVALLRQLSTDQDLGRSARSVLSGWRVA